ncbi:MAG: hypothetical protein JSS10_06305 [Verrucomicrobia bacterium]|nr:hypothetical protein [Verrucomicrobiota bacterium]
MSSQQLDNSSLNRTPSAWNLQNLKDIANASWHHWSVQPLGVKAWVGVGSAVVLGIICMIARKALCSSKVKPTSTRDNKDGRAAETKSGSGESSKPAASPPASEGTTAAANATKSPYKDYESTRDKKDDRAAEVKSSSGGSSKPAASPPAPEGTTAAATATNRAKNDSEKTKWVDVLPNQLSEAPFRNLYGRSINEQHDPQFSPYAQGVYCFKPQAISKQNNIPADKKINVVFSHHGVVFYSESVSCVAVKCAVFLRNLPYERDVMVQFKIDGKSIYQERFKVDQIRGAYTPKRASQKLQEHEFPNLAVSGKLMANTQTKAGGWDINAPVSFILTEKKVEESAEPAKGHYYVNNPTNFVQVVIFEIQIQKNPESPIDDFVSFPVVILPRSDKIISKESLLESVVEAIKKPIPAGAQIGISNIQQIVYTV